MTIIGSCGHDVSAEWDENPRQLDLAIMEYARTGENAVSYGVYCKACREQYERWGVVLHNKQEEERWMCGEMEYPE
jgi:hypothetical protein